MIFFIANSWPERSYRIGLHKHKNHSYKYNFLVVLLLLNIPLSESDRKYVWKTVLKECVLNLDHQDHANVSIILVKTNQRINCVRVPIFINPFIKTVQKNRSIILWHIFRMTKCFSFLFLTAFDRILHICTNSKNASLSNDTNPVNQLSTAWFPFMLRVQDSIMVQ